MMLGVDKIILMVMLGFNNDLTYAHAVCCKDFDAHTDDDFVAEA